MSLPLPNRRCVDCPAQEPLSEPTLRSRRLKAFIFMCALTVVGNVWYVSSLDGRTDGLTALFDAITGHEPIRGAVVPASTKQAAPGTCRSST